jgi:hypothetical protein
MLSTRRLINNNLKRKNMKKTYWQPQTDDDLNWLNNPKKLLNFA